MAHKILIVQDDFLGAERLRVLLEGAGYAVVGVARRSLEALEIADHARPDLAIIDMMLEIDVDGIEAASELARRIGLKILVTTGFPESVIQEEGVHEFACAVVRKPYSDEDLLTAVARCLG